MSFTKREDHLVRSLRNMIQSLKDVLRHYTHHKESALYQAVSHIAMEQSWELYHKEIKAAGLPVSLDILQYNEQTLCETIEHMQKQISDREKSLKIQAARIAELEAAQSEVNRMLDEEIAKLEGADIRSRMNRTRAEIAK